MTLLKWDPKYSTGNKIIDNEHQSLFAIINKLADVNQATDSYPILKEAITELRDYVKTHFVVEEEFMRVYQYPQYEQHKALHRAFSEKVERLYVDIHSGEMTIMNVVIEFIKKWITEHVLKADLEYVPYLPK